MFTNHDKISLPPIDEPQALPPIPPMRLYVVRREKIPPVDENSLQDVMLHAHGFDHAEGVLRFYELIYNDGKTQLLMRRAFNVWVDVEELPQGTSQVAH